VIRRHPELGASLLQRIPFLSGAREIVESHHEKFDGSGYPKGLKGVLISP
jgi:HD-GYP domain-containing protein (c-di-GMP phosphodiesterase class II)